MIEPDLIADAVQRKLADIDRHAAMLQDQQLEHEGHRYYADPGSLETITTTLAVVLMGADADPIPTPGHVAGKWMSADRDPQTGGRVLVPMSNGQFKQMARALRPQRGIVGREAAPLRHGREHGHIRRYGRADTWI